MGKPSTNMLVKRLYLSHPPKNLLIQLWTPDDQIECKVDQSFSLVKPQRLHCVSKVRFWQFTLLRIIFFNFVAGWNLVWIPKKQYKTYQYLTVHVQKVIKKAAENSSYGDRSSVLCNICTMNVGRTYICKSMLPIKA